MTCSFGIALCFEVCTTREFRNILVYCAFFGKDHGVPLLLIKSGSSSCCSNVFVEVCATKKINFLYILLSCF